MSQHDPFPLSISPPLCLPLFLPLSPLQHLCPTPFSFRPKVVVNNVHIRYEDAEADPAHPFAIGMLLENFSAQSTDKYWVSRTHVRT